MAGAGQVQELQENISTIKTCIIEDIKIGLP